MQCWASAPLELELPAAAVHRGRDFEHFRVATIEEARAVGADLLVMGAYTRSRLVEFVLGGATRGAMLENG
jgi:nucleotide-binding universal stress UspA family protein